MTDPTVERTPAWERRYTVGADSTVGGVPVAVWVSPNKARAYSVPTAVEASIRADEATRWREAVEDYDRALDGSVWWDVNSSYADLEAVREAYARLRSMLQEEAR